MEHLAKMNLLRVHGPTRQPCQLEHPRIKGVVFRTSIYLRNKARVSRESNNFIGVSFHILGTKSHLLYAY